MNDKQKATPATSAGAERARALARLQRTLGACERAVTMIAKRGATADADRLMSRIRSAKADLDQLCRASPHELTSERQNYLWDEIDRATRD